MKYVTTGGHSRMSTKFGIYECTCISGNLFHKLVRTKVTPGISRICVAQSSVFCVVVCRSLFFFLSFFHLVILFGLRLLNASQNFRRYLKFYSFDNGGQILDFLFN